MFLPLFLLYFVRKKLANASTSSILSRNEGR
ncbi:hypothetical protein [Flavobacterium sp. 270]